MACWQANDLKFGHVQKAPASRQGVQDPEQSVVRGGVGNRPAVDQGAPEERFDCVPRYELLVRGNYNAISARHDLTFRLFLQVPLPHCVGARLPAGVFGMMLPVRIDPAKHSRYRPKGRRAEHLEIDEKTEPICHAISPGQHHEQV